MKRTLISILLLFSLVSSLFAQDNKPKQIQGTSTSVYATKQESYIPSFDNDGTQAEIRNVILLIGDGMGMGAVNAAMYANGGILTMTSLRHIGMVRTQSANDNTTDSAASGTAYATGYKTNNGYIGVGPDQKPIQNLPEKLEPLGYACGVISTDYLDGATPAAFFAHNVSRAAAEEIWADFPSSKLVFAAAGAKETFESKSLATQEAIKQNFTLVNTLDDVAVQDSQKLLYLPPHASFWKPGSDGFLPATTQVAIDYLSKKSSKGFFLMVEGARIDKAEHSNDLKNCIVEMLDFDKAVEVAIRFAEQDGHTLVVISADHETGAVALTRCNPQDGYVHTTMTSRGHSPMMVPLFAYGPYAQHFGMIQENSDVSNKIYSLLKGDKNIVK